MDRPIVYDGALPQTTDILNLGKMGMVGHAFLARALLGGSTAVHGLACNPTSPASLQVTIGAGSIYALDEVDATAYGDLGTDTNTILKQGILYNPTTLTITPPSTSGYSQVFLVQAILQDIDAGSEVLSYYNATNPAQPFSGPDNDGQSQYTTRTVACTIALKAGAAAATGTQTTPTPDAGYVGLYAITVANGQATVTSANIATLATAPFFPTLPAVPGDVQNGTWVGFDDTSATANTVVITPQPQITALAEYQKFRVKIKNTNTGPSALHIVNTSGTLSAAIQLPSGSALAGGEMKAGSISEFIYDGSVAELTSFPANGGTGGGSGGGEGVAEVYITGGSSIVGSAPGGTKSASWTIEQIVAAVSLGGLAYLGTGLSLSFSGASTGAGGMDTGSMPVSADLSVYAIYNPTTATWSTLGCAGTVSNGSIYSGTHMPSGYTASQLIFSGKTDSSGNIVAFVQTGRKVGTYPFFNFIATGLTDSSGWTELSLSAVVPANAKTWFPGGVCSGGAAGLATNNLYLAPTFLTASESESTGVGAQVLASFWMPGGPAVVAPEVQILTTQVTYYWVINSGGSWGLYCTGYTF
jgi:hypothetical protein